MIKKLLISIAIVLLFAGTVFAPKVGKPLLGRQVNWAHPLSKGLIGCWLINEGAGNKIYDATGNPFEGNFNGTITWDSSPYGPELNCALSTSNYVRLKTGDQLITSYPFTMRIIGKAVAGAWNNRFSLADNSASDQGLCVDFTDDTPPKARGFVYSGAAAIDQVTSSNLVDGNFYDVIFRVKSSATTDRELFINGVNDTANHSLDNTLSFPTGLDRLSLFVWERSTAAASLGDGFVCAMLWDEALTDEQITQLYSKPFCMLKPSFQANLMYVLPAGPAAAGQVIIVNMN